MVNSEFVNRRSLLEIPNQPDIKAMLNDAHTRIECSEALLEAYTFRIECDSA